MFLFHTYKLLISFSIFILATKQGAKFNEEGLSFTKLLT